MFLDFGADRLVLVVFTGSRQADQHPVAFFGIRHIVLRMHCFLDTAHSDHATSTAHDHGSIDHLLRHLFCGHHFEAEPLEEQQFIDVVHDLLVQSLLAAYNPMQMEV